MGHGEAPALGPLGSLPAHKCVIITLVDYRAEDLSERLEDSIADEGAYRVRLDNEVRIYKECLEVHSLPPIYHYWSNKYVQPVAAQFSYSDQISMFQQCLKADTAGVSGKRRILSVGAGNCATEIELACHQPAKGCAEFSIDCVELNPAMLERGRFAAVQLCVDARVNFIQADLNEWVPQNEYDVVIGDQTLHHIVKLEHLFDNIRRALKPSGKFVISDMIGRNGHQRWPEALAIVHEFWRRLPPSYRFNHVATRYEELYENTDYSVDSFEGIRSQDILPLLLEYFHFELFLGFGNVIDPFIDRAFGKNFDPLSSWDRGLIDQIAERDEQEVVTGRITPTHMFAIVGKDHNSPTRFRGSLSPRSCVRNPSQCVPAQPVDVKDAYDWQAWPHSRDRRELQIACQRLKESADCITQSLAHANERTAWALRRDQEFADLAEKYRNLAEKYRNLDAIVQERTAWALKSEVFVYQPERPLKSAI